LRAKVSPNGAFLRITAFTAQENGTKTKDTRSALANADGDIRQTSKSFTGGKLGMKKTKFFRVITFMLAMIFVFGGGAMATSADDTGSSTGNTGDWFSQYAELAETISYNEYLQGSIDSGVKRAEKSESIFAWENYTGVLNDNMIAGEVTEENEELHITYGDDGKPTGLYIPDTYDVTWVTDKITAPGRYNIVIKYYPVENKATPVEKMLRINGKIPFSEACQITMDKIWKTEAPYADVEIDWILLAGYDVQSCIDEAAAHGVKAYVATKTVDNKEKTYLRYEMPSCWTAANTAFVDGLGLRFFTKDIDGNEIRSALNDIPAWYEYTFKDANGYTLEPFEVELAPDANGQVSITLESENEPVIISEIRFEVPKSNITYGEYAAMYAAEPEGKGVLKIEGEYFSSVSSQTIYPVSDNTSAITSPTATDRSLLNTVGGDKWQSAGQWIEYSFSVTDSGKYRIVPRFKQHLLDGIYTSRAIHIFGGNYNGLPFQEAASLKFGYSSDWQVAPLSLNDGTPIEFYFEAGVVYTVRFEVTLGAMGNIVREVQECLNHINEDYLNILKLTGPTPDENNDYGFNRIMPNTMRDMIIQSRKLESIAASLAEEAGGKSTNSATLEKISRVLYEMGSDEESVAKNLEQLKTYIGTLGTWLSDAKTQPLVIDFINIQPGSAPLPKAKPGFFRALWYEILGFLRSFFRNYDRMGAMSIPDENEVVEVWLAYGRDQAQVIRGLINNDFTSVGGAPVNLKLVSAGTLLPSILSGKGPDVYIGLGQGDVINYAIRGALTSIDDLPEQGEYKGNPEAFIRDFGQTPEEFYAEYKESRSDFNEAAMIVLEIENSAGEMHCYGLPETQNFSMMFVRNDIMAELGITKLETWDDVKAAIPVLQANNMQIGMHNDVKIFLYQYGDELFADGGMRINLDSPVAEDAFSTMCDFFTMYSFPYKYDFANRFRTGEMPIGFATYTATYNQLKVFATEIEGLWSMYPMPGVYNNEGKINRESVSTVSAIVMIVGCENKHDSWEFMRWHVGAKCQVDYSNEMVAILGPSAKHATASRTALESMPWTNAERNQIMQQFDELASIPNYPGSYIVDRYLKFAFLDAYDDNLDPVKALRQHISTINKEIARKRQEFDLEILEIEVKYEIAELKDERKGSTRICATLAEKRLREAYYMLCDMSYGAEYNDVCGNLTKLITMSAYETRDHASIGEFTDNLEALAHSKGNNQFDDVIGKLRDAIKALKSYETYRK